LRIGIALIEPQGGIMNEMAAMNTMSGDGVGGIKGLGNVQLELPRASVEDGAQFRAALDRHMADPIPEVQATGTGKSMGDVVAARFSGLASEFQKDQQYVSKLLEKATRTGDSMHLMRAMLALNDYQIRVQVMSKTVAKAAGSIDQLTKMQ
jgi:hypothetical protein